MNRDGLNSQTLLTTILELTINPYHHVVHDGGFIYAIISFLVVHLYEYIIIPGIMKFIFSGSKDIFLNTP